MAVVLWQQYEYYYYYIYIYILLVANLTLFKQSTIEPYMYEPEESGSDSESTDSSDDSMHGERLLNI